MLAAVRQLLTQVVGLGLGELAAVLGRGDGQGVLLAYSVQFGPQSGHALVQLRLVDLEADFAASSRSGWLVGRRRRVQPEAGGEQVVDRDQPAPCGVWTELGKSPASRRRRIVVRLTPHAVTASRWVSIGRGSYAHPPPNKPFCCHAAMPNSHTGFRPEKSR